MTQAKSVPLTIIVLALAFFVFRAAVGISESHAIQRHGSQAVAVRLADKCGDPDYVFVNGDREARCWEFDENGNTRYGLRIIEDGEEVTAFIQKAKRTFDEFVSYMQRRNYTLIGE